MWGVLNTEVLLHFFFINGTQLSSLFLILRVAFHEPRTYFSFSCFGNVNTFVSFVLVYNSVVSVTLFSMLSKSYSSSSMFCGHDLKISIVEAAEDMKNVVYKSFKL